MIIDLICSDLKIGQCLQGIPKWNCFQNIWKFWYLLAPRGIKRVKIGSQCTLYIQWWSCKGPEGSGHNKSSPRYKINFWKSETVILRCFPKANFIFGCLVVFFGFQDLYISKEENIFINPTFHGLFS